MPTQKTRKDRGRETEFIVAQKLAAYWPDAVASARSLPGNDVLNVGRLAIEVKATSATPILAAVRQSNARMVAGEIPVGIWRPNGYGEARFNDWVVFTSMGTFIEEIAPRAGWFLD